LHEQLFTEDQDFCDYPDRGIFVIKVILATVEEFLLCARLLSENFIFVGFDLPKSLFYKRENSAFLGEELARRDSTV